jgi:type I restriction enzyme M protein
LAVQLAGIIGKTQTEQRSKGSSGQIELYPSDIEQFTIFLPSLDEQNVIGNKMIEAYKARQRALVLVDEATRAVEIAIEQDKAAAMANLAAN